MNADYQIFTENVSILMKTLRENRKKLLERYRKRFSQLCLENFIPNLFIERS